MTDLLISLAVSIAVIIAILGLTAVALQPHGIAVLMIRNGRPIGLFYIHENTVSEVVATANGFTVGVHQASAK